MTFDEFNYFYFHGNKFYQYDIYQYGSEINWISFGLCKQVRHIIAYAERDAQNGHMSQAFWNIFLLFFSSLKIMFSFMN